MSQSTVNINVLSLNVPALPDNDIAFANAAAWNAYWAQANFSANVPIADTANYGVIKRAITTPYVDPGTTGDQTKLFNDTLGATYPLVLQGSFDELKAQVAALNSTVKQMRTALLNAGIISAV